MHIIKAALKWSLAAMGLYLVIGLSITELREHRLGLGTGVVVAVVAGAVKGVAMWMKSRQR